MFVYILHNVSEKTQAFLSGHAVIRLDPTSNKFSHIALGAHKYPTVALTYQEKSGIYKFTKVKNLTKPNNSIGIASMDITGDGFEELLITQKSNYLLYYTYNFSKKKWNEIKIKSPYDFSEKDSLMNSSITIVPNAFLIGNTKYPPFLLKYDSVDKKCIIDKESVILKNIKEPIFNTRSIINFKGLFKEFDGIILNGSNLSYQIYPQYMFKINNDKINVNYFLNQEKLLVNAKSATFLNVNPKERIYGLLIGNFGSTHILYLFHNKKLIGTKKLTASFCSCVYAADFDNDGHDEIFFLNYRQYNQLYRVEDENNINNIEIGQGYTGKYYYPLQNTTYISTVSMDLDNDGILEIFNTSGDSFFSGNALLKATNNNTRGNNYLRVYPMNSNGSPHKGAIVSIKFNELKYKRIIDNGGNVYSQSEPIAHFGLGKYNSNVNVLVEWTNGSKTKITNVKPNQLLKVVM